LKIFGEERRHYSHQCGQGFTGTRLKPCPHWRLGDYSRRIRRQFVAVFGDSRRIPATVAVFGDSRRQSPEAVCCLHCNESSNFEYIGTFVHGMAGDQ